MSPHVSRRRLAATAAVIAALCAAGGAEARTCSIAAIEGAGAELWVEGRWRAIAAPDLPRPLPPVAAILRTGPDARLELTCNDGVAVTLGVSSELNLATLTEPSPDGGVLLRLLRGAVAAVARGGWPEFEIRSPLVIAAVRSTEWAVIHEPTEGSAVFVREGVVAVRAAQGEGAAVLAAGEGVDMPPAGPLGPVRSWGAPRVAALGARLGHGWR
ncbi:FecR family protein [Albimonas pacifica]|uniref:FecR family protein n=1 Tax=Albimonas pacifica TaxID=1114924 RepID=A0A1I3BZ82_9RHOB|nr:FecR family protein [Albimonas pacifica]SFH67356.1 FecR family protein [Albimonas pacifica]